MEEFRALENLALEARGGRRGATVLNDLEARVLIELHREYGYTAVVEALKDASGFDAPVASARRSLRRAAESESRRLEPPKRKSRTGIAAAWGVKK